MAILDFKKIKFKSAILILFSLYSEYGGGGSS